MGKEHGSGGGIIHYLWRYWLCDPKILMYQQCGVLKWNGSFVSKKKNGTITGNFGSHVQLEFIWDIAS